ncbi:MAG: lysophospholipid acyltransferase family protein [Thermoguttaceae bacterium]|nr:lysophospholipid acyltransferase family protein [Thermoguttaceae bacterium]
MKLRSRWIMRLAACLGATTIRAWMGTVRHRVISADQRRHPTDPAVERFIYAFWHESLLAPAKIKTRVKVLVSQSADGEFIALVCKHLGIGVVRGSTTRGGAKGLLDLLREGRDAHLAITPDGPRGPRRQVKPGVAFLASHTGLPVVPVGVGFTRAWRAGSWDRFAIPHPFSTLVGVLGEPIAVPVGLDAGALETHRRRIEQAMLAATEAAETCADQLSRRGPHDNPLACPPLNPVLKRSA